MKIAENFMAGLYLSNWLSIKISSSEAIPTSCLEIFFPYLHFHIDLTTLADGTYELVPESEREQREAQVNLTKITEDLNQSSEEPKASSAQEGKPRSMSYLF